MRDANRFYACLSPLAKHFIKTPFHGAQTTLFCALDDSVAALSGRYFADCREKRPHQRALIEEHWQRLWEISEEMVGLKA